MINSNQIEAIYKLYSQVTNTRGDEAFDADGNPVAYDEATVQAYIDANAYKKQRAQAYPSIADQLDILYHGGYDEWKATIQTVKERFPK
jgi:methyl coenzyme M reductase subunit C-like uncharacterized protein (methanogenesis marker protein 7)